MWRCAALETALLLLAVPVEREVMRAGLIPKTTGLSMGMLCDAAREHGLTATLRRVSFTELRNHAGTAVLWVDDDHFVAVDPRETRGRVDEVRVYDHGQPAVWFSQTALQRRWRGECLLLRAPSSRRHSPCVEWDSLLLDSGNARGVDAVEYVFRYRSIGEQLIYIDKIKTSCGCTSVESSGQYITPGEIGTIGVYVDSKPPGAFFRERIALLLRIGGRDDTQLVTLFVQGAITPPIGAIRPYLVPRSIDLGNVTPGETRCLGTILEASEEGDLLINAAALREASVEGVELISFGQSCVRTAHSGSSHSPLTHFAQEGEKGVAFRIGFPTYAQPGPIYMEIETDYSYNGEFFLDTVRVMAEMQSPFHVSPAALRLSRGKPSATISVTHSFAGEIPLPVRSCATAPYMQISDPSVSVGNSGCTVQVQMKPNTEMPEVWLGYVSIRLAELSEIRVPVIIDEAEEIEASK